MSIIKTATSRTSRYTSSLLLISLLSACGGSSSPENHDVSANSEPPSATQPGELGSPDAQEEFLSTHGIKKRRTTDSTVAPAPAPAPTNGSCPYPEWSSLQSYAAGAIVRYAANGNYYRAKYANPGYDPTISTWYWEPYNCSTTVTESPTTTTPTTGGFIVSEAQFNQMFPNRNAFYTYSGLVAALSAYPAIFNTGSDVVKKQEVAAFLANINHETGGLQYIREINQANWPYYCQASSEYPCAQGQQYYGRGPIQLSWNYNYGAAGKALGLNLLADPDLVARDSTVAWKTAIWFWMTQSGAGSMTPHSAMVNSRGFAETIRSINGALECNKAAGSVGHEQMQTRVRYYQQFTQTLGVATGSNLTANH